MFQNKTDHLLSTIHQFMSNNLKKKLDWIFSGCQQRYDTEVEIRNLQLTKLRYIII